MFTFKFEEGFAPSYATLYSAGADLRSRLDLTIEPGLRVLVPTGVWITSYDPGSLEAKGMVAELQIRSRSSLAYKHGIMLANGVGTVDADYRDELLVALYNSSSTAFSIQRGDRIAQLLCQLAMRLPLAVATDLRLGGFGSTGKN